MTRRTIVDLFCGAGGLSLGFKQAGFEPVLAIDFDRYACATYAENLGNHVRQLDLAAADPVALAKMVLSTHGSVDVVAGGPPCQGWSVQRRGHSVDVRNDLTLKFAAIATAIRPKVIVMENVPTILGKRGQKHLAAIEQEMRDVGYVVSKTILDAAWFGVPQARRRAVLVATHETVGTQFRFPEPTQDPTKPVTVRQAIGDMPPPPPDGSEHVNYRNHRLVLASKANLERLSYVPEGGGRLGVPESLQLPCHRAENGHRHLDVYGRLWWDRPAGTITAMFDNFTRGRFAHPSENRNITSREGARLQSFPDDFVFLGPKKDVARQIGNAVAPALARALGNALLRLLDEGRHTSEQTCQRGFAILNDAFG